MLDDVELVYRNVPPEAHVHSYADGMEGLDEVFSQVLATETEALDMTLTLNLSLSHVGDTRAVCLVWGG